MCFKCFLESSKEQAANLAAIAAYSLKSQVQCFSMQVVMNKCFLNPEKNWLRSVLSFFKKNTHLNSKSD